MIHYCNAERCPTPISPKYLMCGRHWRLVPKPLQAAVWAAYVPGQETRGDQTEAYLEAADAAIAAVRPKVAAGPVVNPARSGMQARGMLAVILAMAAAGDGPKRKRKRP